MNNTNTNNYNTNPFSCCCPSISSDPISNTMKEYIFTNKLRKQFKSVCEDEVDVKKRIVLIENMELILSASRFSYPDYEKELLGKKYLLAIWEVILDMLSVQTLKVSSRQLLYSLITSLMNREEFLLTDNAYTRGLTKLPPKYNNIMKKYALLLRLTLLEAVSILRTKSLSYQIEFAAEVVAFCCFRLPSFRSYLFNLFKEDQGTLPSDLIDITKDIVTTKILVSPDFDIVFGSPSNSLPNSYVAPSTLYSNVNNSMNTKKSISNNTSYNYNNKHQTNSKGIYIPDVVEDTLNNQLGSLFVSSDDEHNENDDVYIHNNNSDSNQESLNHTETQNNNINTNISMSSSSLSNSNTMFTIHNPSLLTPDAIVPHPIDMNTIEYKNTSHEQYKNPSISPFSISLKEENSTISSHTNVKITSKSTSIYPRQSSQSVVSSSSSGSLSRSNSIQEDTNIHRRSNTLDSQSDSSISESIDSTSDSQSDTNENNKDEHILTDKNEDIDEYKHTTLQSEMTNSRSRVSSSSSSSENSENSENSSSVTSSSSNHTSDSSYISVHSEYEEYVEDTEENTNLYEQPTTSERLSDIVQSSSNYSIPNNTTSNINNENTTNSCIMNDNIASYSCSPSYAESITSTHTSQDQSPVVYSFKYSVDMDSDESDNANEQRNRGFSILSNNSLHFPYFAEETEYNLVYENDDIFTVTGDDDLNDIIEVRASNVVNLNEYTSVDTSLLPPLMVKNYAIVIDNLCRRAMYSKRIYDKGLDYQRKCLNIFDWSLIDSTYNYDEFEFNWIDRFNKYDSFFFAFVQYWFEYIYTYSNTYPIIWSSIPGYFLILRLYFPRFQKCVLSQLTVGIMRNQLYGHLFYYNQRCLKASKSLLFNTGLANELMNILFGHCNAFVKSDILLCLIYLDEWFSYYKLLYNYEKNHFFISKDIRSMCISNKIISPEIKLLTSLQKHNKITNKFPTNSVNTENDYFSNFQYNRNNRRNNGNSHINNSIDNNRIIMGIEGFTYKQAITLFFNEGIAKDEEEANAVWELLQEQGILKEINSQEYDGTLYTVKPKYIQFQFQEQAEVSLPRGFNYELFFKAFSILMNDERIQILVKVLYFVYCHIDLFNGTYRRDFIQRCIFPQFLRLFCHWNNDVRYLFQCICIYKLFRTRRDQLPCFKSEDIKEKISVKELDQYNAGYGEDYNENTYVKNSIHWYDKAIKVIYRDLYIIKKRKEQKQSFSSEDTVTNDEKSVYNATIDMSLDHESQAIDLVLSSKLDSYLLLCIQQCKQPNGIVIEPVLKPYVAAAMNEYINLLIGYEKEEIYTDHDKCVPALSIDPHLYMEEQKDID